MPAFEHLLRRDQTVKPHRRIPSFPMRLVIPHARTSLPQWRATDLTRNRTNHLLTSQGSDRDSVDLRRIDLTASGNHLPSSFSHLCRYPLLQSSISAQHLPLPRCKRLLFRGCELGSPGRPRMNSTAPGQAADDLRCIGYIGCPSRPRVASVALLLSVALASRGCVNFGMIPISFVT